MIYIHVHIVIAYGNSNYKANNLHVHVHVKKIDTFWYIHVYREGLIVINYQIRYPKSTN